MNIRCVIATLAFVLAIGPSSPVLGQEDEAWNWINKRYYDVLDLAFPLEGGTGHGFSVRVHRDLHRNVPEWSLLARRSFQTGTIECVLREADGEPIADQLHRLYREHADATPEALVALLRIRERRFIEADCLSVRRLYEAFYMLRLPMMTEEHRAEFEKGTFSIVLHPMIYRFQAHISNGNAGFTLTDEWHPFVVWAETARQQLRQCDHHGSKMRQSK